jgi:hypothetical protein
VLMALVMILIISCKATQGKGGTRQPKKGPMPCPIKDC